MVSRTLGLASFLSVSNNLYVGAQVVKLLSGCCWTGELPRSVLQPGLLSALAQASVRVTALDEGLVHGSTILTHATTLGGGADVVGDRMAAPMDPDRLKSLGCS